jgi:integrase
MRKKRRLPEQYHDYEKDPFCITHYRDRKRPDLKWAVRTKLNGKWERKFFTTKSEAETHVDIKRVELLNQGKEGMAFPTALRVMAQRCADKLNPFGATIDDATEFYMKHLQTEKQSVPVEQAVDELIADRQGQGFSELYIRDLKYRLGRFAQAFAGRSVASITRDEIKTWLKSLGVGASTRNTFRRDVRTLFSFCSEEKKYRADNPAKGKGLSAKKLRGEPDILTVEEARRLIANASPDMLPYWSIGLFAGVRPSEIRRLEWSAIDFEQKHIAVRAHKGEGKKRLVKMEPNLIKWLRPYRKRSGKVVAPVNFRKESPADRAAAGLSERWTQDIMRHSYASYWMAKFKNLHALAEQMGNSPKVVIDHYKTGVSEREAKAFWKIAPSSDKTSKIVQGPFAAAA